MPKEKCSRWWKLPNILNGDIFNPIWSWCCQRAEIGRKCDYFVWIGTDKRKESDDADENLRRGEVEVELAQLGNNGRTECGQWIPPSHISLSSKLANTLLVDICWWKCFGGICFEYLYFTSLLRNTNTHRKEKIRKYIWRVTSTPQGIPMLSAISCFLWSHQATGAGSQENGGAGGKRWKACLFQMVKPPRP